MSSPATGHEDATLRLAASAPDQEEETDDPTHFGSRLLPRKVMDNIGEIAPELPSLPKMEDLNPQALKELATNAKEEATQDLVHLKDEVLKDISNFRDVLSKREEHQRALAESVPEVAVMLTPGDSRGTDNVFEKLELPEHLKVTLDAGVTFFGEQRRLLAFRMEPANGVPKPAPAKELIDLMACVNQQPPFASVTVWPLHDSKVSDAVIAMEATEMRYGVGMEELPAWRRTLGKVLRALRITTPSTERVETFEFQYGPGVEFAFAWSAFFIQQLWLLVLYAIIWLAVDGKSLRTKTRWAYELLKLGVCLWSVWVAIQTTWRHRRPEHKARSQIRRSDVIASSWKEHETCTEKARRRLIILLLVTPSILVLIAALTAIFSMVTVLVLYIIFVWGDCLHSIDPCLDAQAKYGFLGWLAEVACDILLAILFELFSCFGEEFSAWIGQLMNYRYQSDVQLFTEMLVLALNAVERIGFVGSLAFLFAPQWADSACGDPHKICPDADCGDLLMGDIDYRCFQRRLPMETRRWFFEALLKGPFIVAPFIEILVKVIIPKAAVCINHTLSHTAQWKCCCWLAPLRGAIRICMLIFTYHGPTVGCLKYVFRGYPFGEIPEDVPDREKILTVLDQVVLKEFNVDNELMELEMSFLWVTFFMPMMPQGVIVTMVAKLLEVNFDITKLLYVRRRPTPMDDRVCRRELIAYAWCIAMTSSVWTLGLSLITYNDHFHEWGNYGLGLFLFMIAWLAVVPVVTIGIVNRITGRVRIVSRSRLFKVRPEPDIPKPDDTTAS